MSATMPGWWLQKIYETKAQVEREMKMRTFWMVKRHGDKMGGAQAVHLDPSEALTEAERLCKKENDTFVVLRAVAMVYPKDVEVQVVWEDMNESWVDEKDEVEILWGNRKEPSPKVSESLSGDQSSDGPADDTGHFFDPDCEICAGLQADGYSLSFVHPSPRPEEVECTCGYSEHEMGRCRAHDEPDWEREVAAAAEARESALKGDPYHLPNECKRCQAELAAGLQVSWHELQPDDEPVQHAHNYNRDGYDCC